MTAVPKIAAACAVFLALAVAVPSTSAAVDASPPSSRLARPLGNDEHGPRVGSERGSAHPGIRQAAPRQKPATPQATQQRILDELFARLQRSTDSDESEGIARSIKRIWLRSGSDTADLLMTRAGKAMGAKKAALAQQLLDKIVGLEPGWAEAWNRRATVRYNEFDDDGAMADIAQVLVREPRHFGALSGMGYILERHDLHKQALKVFRKVLALYPRQEEIRKMVDKLTVDVEGRDI